MKTSARMRLRVVIPVFNDWESLSILLRELDRTSGSLGYELIISVIDDGSTQPDDMLRQVVRELQAIEQVERVQLAVNVGHQRAIAVGLCRAADSEDCDAVLVMDSDGEDPPEAIPLLLEQTRG